MSRHYWPEPPKEKTVEWHFVEHKNGERHHWYLDKWGHWSTDKVCEITDTEDMQKRGYLGVRTPFSEEAERAAFEAAFPLPQGHDEMDLHVQFEQWRAWLAAKRHERSL